MLKLSRWINIAYPGELGRHLRIGSSFSRMPRSLARFARNPFEKLAAKYWELLDLKPFSACRDEHEMQFLFQCVYVPLFATLQIELISRTVEGVNKFWLYPAASYLIGWERMHLEMVVSLTRDPINTYQGLCWEKPFSVRSFNHLPKPSVEWFLPPPGERSYWLNRLGAWREAAEKSFLSYLACVNPNIDAWDPKDVQKAAVAGTMHRLSPFPRKTLGEMVATYATSHNRALEAFTKHAYGPEYPNNSFNPDLDGWLIEFWPSICERKWKYPQISSVAARKFIRISDKQATSPSGIEARCERLELKLHPSARRGGRAKILASDPFQLMGEWLDSFASRRQAWLSGQRGLVAGVSKLVVDFL
jgi:hypothetical protein